MVNRVPIVLDGESNLIITETIDGQVTLCNDGEFGVVTEIRQAPLPYYTGPTEITPSSERVVLDTNDHTMISNITINPIPSNYGLVTWDGSTLTIS